MSAREKTTAFLKECLADALLQLMETRPFGKITIPEIADLAGVGRTTYFRNFRSKEEMLSFKLIQLWERWTDEHRAAKRSCSPEDAPVFFAFIYSIRSMLTLLYEQNLQSALYGAFNAYLTPQPEADARERYRSSFYSYGLFGLLDEWIAGGFSESPEQMAAIARELR